MKNYEVKAWSFWFGFLILLLVVTSCKTKSLSVEKLVEVDNSSYSKKFDSLFELASKLKLDYTKNQSLLSSVFNLKSIVVLDSLGNQKPLHFKHYIDGKLAEEIYLEGGELNRTEESKETSEVEKKNEVKAEKSRIESDVGIEIDSKKASKTKAKQVEVKGFQFGFYLWLFLIIVVLIVLRWIANKLKLPDKIKDLFGNKGG